ncbi:MAG TPA: PDZ domain-containing protein, partial [Egibacteraceae bacterium]|nr:PDZ domain-containing protein [Egibacteraceae bacterium]
VAEPGTPAAGAGVRAGDVIVTVDGEPVDAMEDLYAALRARAPGDRLPLEIARGGGRLSVTPVLADRPEG